VNALYGNELTWDLNAFVLSRSSRRDGRLKCSSRKQNARERISSSLSRRVSCNKRRISDRGMRNSPWLRLSYGERMDWIGAERVTDEESLAERVTMWLRTKELAESRIILSCLNSRQKRVSSSKMSNFVTRLMIVFAFSFYVYFLSLFLPPPFSLPLSLFLCSFLSYLKGMLHTSLTIALNFIT